MPTSARRHRPFGDRPAPPTRGTANASGYTYRWQQYAKAFLTENPICVECKKEGLIRAAHVVDHVRPHRGDDGLFWDQTNHQALCVRHHGAKSARSGLGGPG